MEKFLILKNGEGTKQTEYVGKAAVILYPEPKERIGKWSGGGRGFNDCSCINAIVDESFWNDKELHESIKITVEYFDAGNGSFAILYDGEDGEVMETEIVDLHNSMRWRDYTFYIKNPKFNKRCGGYDFRVSVYSPTMNNSLEAVAVGNISISKTGIYAPVKILPAKSENPGNIFFNGDVIKLQAQLINRVNEALELNVKYSVIDRDTFECVYSNSDRVNIAEKGNAELTVCPEIKKYGVYLLKIELTDDEGKIYCSKNTKLAKVNSSEDVPANMTLGFSDHFAQGRKGDPEIPLMLMRKGGFGINRDEILWSDYELKKDEFVVPEFEAKYLENAAKYGIEPCFTLGKNNEAVGVKNCPARTKEEQERWRLYVRNVVKDLKGKVSLYSIYNESNIEFKKTSSVHWYVEDLKIAYEEIKSIDPDAKVLGFTTANIPYYWFEEAFKQGALNYCDIVDIHPYGWNTAPEEFDFVERVNRIYSLIKKYGGNHPVWNTEYGYPVMVKGCGIPSEYLQGVNLMHTYLHCRANNILDKFYIYQFADTYLRNRSDAEANFGILYTVMPELRETPYAAKPAYLMLANMNNILAEAECLGEFFCHDRMIMIRFKKPDGTQVFVHWAYWNTCDNFLTMNLGVQSINVYDKYGNKSVLESENGIFEIPVTRDTIFVEGAFTAFEDLSDYPA